MDQITSRQPETPARYPQVSAIGAQRAFSMAMVISGIRCVIAYILLPFVAPLVGLAPGVGPWLGIGIGVVAIIANVFSIRRFARSEHRLRKPIIAINIAVIAFMLVLIAVDLNTVSSI
ncbi:MAG TPA: hypothetical protein VMM14_01150 [Acidimicrobiia bacterium]|nr:hypothetical protein [Acidimicrobiia bacterium]